MKMVSAFKYSGLATLFIALAAPVAAQELNTVGRSYDSRDARVPNFQVNTNRGAALATDSRCDIRARSNGATSAYSLLQVSGITSSFLICVIDDREENGRLLSTHSSHCSCDDRDSDDRGDRSTPDTPDTPGENDSTGTGRDDGGDTGGPGRDDGGPGRDGGPAAGGPSRG